MSLEQNVHRGSRAREVLENEEFIAAFDAIEAEILDQWKNSPARDQAGRESLWSYLMLAQKFKQHLTTTLESGKLAQVQLAHDQRMQELRTPSWNGPLSRVA